MPRLPRRAAPEPATSPAGLRRAITEELAPTDWSADWSGLAQAEQDELVAGQRGLAGVHAARRRFLTGQHFDLDGAVHNALRARDLLS